jgi:hypothetical protein
MEEERKAYKVLVGKPVEKDHSEDRGVDGRTGLEWILVRLAGACSGFSWLRIVTSGGIL